MARVWKCRKTHCTQFELWKFRILRLWLKIIIFYINFCRPRPTPIDRYGPVECVKPDFSTMGCSWGSKTPKNRDVFYFVAHVFFCRKNFCDDKKKTSVILAISRPPANRFLWPPHQKIGNEKLPMGQYGPFSRKLSQSFLKFEKPKIYWMRISNFGASVVFKKYCHRCDSNTQTGEKLH